MGVKNVVFASRSERDNFNKLARQWGDKYKVWHNLPFLHIFTTDNINLTDVELSRLKKTSIDYILCDENDAPLLCIEFDGIQQGVNIGLDYKPKKGFDVWRSKITELKLRVAHSNNFPFFVVGDREFADIGKDIRLTIVDGIIGNVLARKEFKRRFRDDDFIAFTGLSEEEFAQLPHENQQEWGESFGIHTEVSTALENNPVERMMWELRVKQYELGVVKSHGIGGAGFRNEAVTSGFAWVDSEQFGHIERVVVVPQFNTPGLEYSGELARQIAELLVHSELQRRIDTNIH